MNRKQRQAAEREARQRGEVEAARAAYAAGWAERRAEEAEMSTVWADHVLAHQPALAEYVTEGRWSLRQAVTFVRDTSGCDVGCGHRPLTEEQAQALLEHVAESGGPSDRA